MKELTIEQKAQRYDEAIKKAKGVIEQNPLMEYLKKGIEYILPELKESEDEKTRKELIKIVSKFQPEVWKELSETPQSVFIAWLEKQGEQNPADINPLLSWSSEEEKMLQCLEGIVKDYWAKSEQEKNELKIREANNVSFFLKTIHKSPLCWIKCSDGLPNRDGIYLVVTDGIHNDVYDMARYDSIEGWHKASEIIYWMPIPQLNDKSIIEQKHIDKVEPKFHEGDWVVDENGIVKQILSYKDGVYKHTDGYSAEIFEDEWRMWDITKDAKAGDVLAYKDEISIYKHDIKNYTKEGTNFGGFVYHCCYDGKRFITDSLYSLTEKDKKDIYPATKEQRSLLFQKMREAGYEWDAEQKQLRKIEQKHTPKHKVGDTIYYNSFGKVKSMIVANVVTDSTDNPMYEDENGSVVFEKDLIEQNLAKWSKEDLPEFESYLCLMFQKFRTKGVCTNGEIVDFVKEHSQKLKDTLCHPWSEEDEKMLEYALDMIEWYSGKNADKSRLVSNWLKDRVQKK